MSYAVAAAPFAVAAAALLVLRWSAGRAGAATLAAAALGALLSPGLDAGAIPGSLAEGAAICARVLVILFGGLLLHNVLSRGGAVGEVTRFLDGVEPDRERDVVEAAVATVGFVLAGQVIAGSGAAALLAGIQNVAGSHASYLSPQRLVLAATATGLVGREGEVAKAAVAPVVVVVLLLAAVGVVVPSFGR